MAVADETKRAAWRPSRAWPALLAAGLLGASAVPAGEAPAPMPGATAESLTGLVRTPLEDYPVYVHPTRVPRGQLVPTAIEVLSAQHPEGKAEIVFACRGDGRDGHYYANFGFDCRRDDAWLYGGVGGILAKMDLRTRQVTRLVDDPEGDIRDPSVHYDGRTVLFSWRKGGTNFHHLWEVQSDGTGLRQVTSGDWDDIEAVYAPDGGIVFCSTRCDRWVPCNAVQVAILYRSDRDGGNIRPLSVNHVTENTPAVLPDGRIAFTRWEYVDRSQNDYHHLWTVNPDGTGQMTYFGNMHPGHVIIDAQPVPGSDQVLAVFSSGHGTREHSGTIMVIDPGRGPDAIPMARRIGRMRGHDPFPISPDLFLMKDLTLCDMAGQAEGLLPRGKDSPLGRLRAHEARPLVPRPREPVLPDRTDYAQPAGRFLLSDVTHGRAVAGVGRGEVTRLLILEPLHKPVNYSGLQDCTSSGGTFLLERVLGTVPVEPDGSAYFEVPAMRAVFFVALDGRGAAVKRMQSFVHAMPGETTGCTGCHERRSDAPRSRQGAAVLAARRPPSRIEPFADMPDVFDWQRDVEPIIRKHCTACHKIEEKARWVTLPIPVQTNAGYSPKPFGDAYSALMRGALKDGTLLVAHGYNGFGNRPPRTVGAAASGLMKIVAGQYGNGKHKELRLSERERLTLWLWIETGAPNVGTYGGLGGGSREVPSDGYLRLMRRYGLLPAASEGPFDAYDLDQAYWRRSWHHPR